METSAQSKSSMATRPQLLLPLSRTSVGDVLQWELSTDLSEASSAVETRSLASLMTPVRHVSRSMSTLSTASHQQQLSSHVSCGGNDFISPSSAESNRSLNLLSPHTLLPEMTFTSAFSLRNRRGKTLILPKLKIPRTGSAVSTQRCTVVGRPAQRIARSVALRQLANTATVAAKAAPAATTFYLGSSLGPGRRSPPCVQGRHGPSAPEPPWR